MAMFELFGIGRGWAGAFKADPLDTAAAPVSPDSLISDSSVRINDLAGSAPDRNRLRKASDALQAAFGSFVRQTKPIYTTNTATRPAAPAAVAGMSARVDAIDADYYGLQTTNEVNSRTSTVRTSWGAIGLDATTPDAFSVLTSGGSLGLDLDGAASVKSSVAEMNAGFATSYGSSSLTFADGSSSSTSIGSLTGTYKGTGKAADATSLAITITKGGTLDSGGILGLNRTKVSFDVTDQTGEVVFSYSGNIAAGDTVSLGSDIGLSLTFGAGVLTAGHKASTTVTKTPITVDADARFNAAPAVRPQFEAVAAVTAGSFAINNTVIQVFADDTVNTVLDRISNSAAGITATLSGDRVTLTTKANSDQNIDITGDTSGFVKAVRLDGASTTLGNLRDDERLLKDTTVFKNIRTGTFTINGRTISIDKSQDTLATVLARINGSGAGVSASLNPTTNRIEIVSTSIGEEAIVVGNDTTGFLGMAQLAASNTVVGNIRDDRQVLSDVAQFAGVTSGSFFVNGVAIAVDAETDSLSSIISRINASGAGVTASYDAAADRFTFTPDVAGATLSLDGDTTGLLAALKVATGTAATRANVDGAFNATGVDGPLFDAGYAVQAGSFTVNGVTIDVAADDTINAVLAKITASTAGVIAAYDATTDRVSLTSRESGAPITVGADTSGFLAAVKLDATATSSVSTISYSSFNTALGEIVEYAGVTTGTLTVNDQVIVIDPMTTTVSGLVSALNGLNGVSASVDQTSGAIRIWSDAGQSLTLSDSSGILSVLGMSPGTVYGTAASTGAITAVTGESTTSNAREVAARAAAAVEELNDAIEGVSSDALRKALDEAFDALRDQGIRGFSVDEEQPVVSVATDELIHALEDTGGDVDVETALASVLEAFDAAVASAAEPAESARAAQTFRLEMSRTQLMAEQAAGSLLHVRSSLQPHESPEATRRTVLKAYGAEPQ